MNCWKIVATIFIMLSLVATVSALTFDNIKSVEGDVVTIKDNFGLGSDLAVIEKLENTDYCLNECHTIWNISIKSDEDTFLDKVDFKNIYGGERNLQYKFEYASGHIQHEIIEYNETCVGKGLDRVCTKKEIGSHYEYEIVWSSFDPQKKMIGDYTIKLTGYKLPQEDIDWVPTFMGKEIDEWAWWISAAPAKLFGYYKLNEASSGDNATDSGIYGNDCNTTAASSWVEGKLNNARATGIFNAGRNTQVLYNTDFTIAFWANMTSSGSYANILSECTSWVGEGCWVVTKKDDDQVFFIGDDTVAGSDSCIVYANDTSYVGDWHYFVITRDIDAEANALKMYVDGLFHNQSDCGTDDSFDGEGANLLIANGPLAAYAGQLDDVSIWNYTWTSTDVETGWASGAGRELDDIPLTDYVTENSITYDADSYEGEWDYFEVNVTYNGTGDIADINATFNYAGTAYDADEASDTGTEILFSYNLSVVDGNYTFFFNYTISNVSGQWFDTGSSYEQIVNNISFAFCDDTTSDTVFLNFTFKDESTNTAMNASNDLTDIDLYISGVFIETYTYSNNTNFWSYGFCMNPPYETAVIDLTFKYSKTGYPLRTFYYDDKSLTNSTTNETLYLLPSTDGIYSSFQVVNIGGGTIEGASVTAQRQIGGTWTTMEAGTTDASGLITFWLDSNYDHRISVTATGYDSETVTIRPTQSTYTIVLGAVTNTTYTSDIDGVYWIAYPASGVLQPATNQNFNVTVWSTEDNLDDCKFELLYSNLTVIDTDTGVTNTSYCYLEILYTTTEDINLFGRLSVDTTDSDGWVIVDTDWKWILIDTDNEVSAWRTMKSFFEELQALDEFGETDNASEFSRFIFFFIMTTILIGFFTYFSGIEISNPGLSMVIIWVVVVIASIGGFLSFNSGSDNINPFVEQYGFSVLLTMLIIALFANSWRKENG